MHVGSLGKFAVGGDCVSGDEEDYIGFGAAACLSQIALRLVARPDNRLIEGRSGVRENR
jgi:hypothetical protein